MTLQQIVNLGFKNVNEVWQLRTKLISYTWHESRANILRAHSYLFNVDFTVENENDFNSLQKLLSNYAN